METKYTACADFKSARAEHSRKTCKTAVVSLKIQFFTAPTPRKILKEKKTAKKLHCFCVILLTDTQKNL